MSGYLVRPARADVFAGSEETLRAVAQTLENMGDDPVAATLDAKMQELQELARFLSHSYSELAAILGGLRATRGLLRRAEVDRLQRTGVALQEVTHQTEVATTDMLDALERGLSLLDTMVDGEEMTGARGEAEEGLREELLKVMHLLQFQDITSQQISAAGETLADVEVRLTHLVRTLEEYGVGIEEAASAEPEEVPGGPSTCDPEATTFRADERQALADDIFS